MLAERWHSTVIQAHLEAQAAMGMDAYATQTGNRWEYVNWLVDLRRDGEAERRKQRETREARWAEIASGEREALGSVEAEQEAAARGEMLTLTEKRLPAVQTT